MSRRDLSHLSDRVLLEALHTLVARDRATTADLIAHLAEVDARKLYLPAAQPSIYHYCVNVLLMSEDAALKRIQVARASREVPEILEALSDGSVHLSAAVLLAPHLRPDNAEKVLAEARHRSKREIELLVARLAPRPDVPTGIRATTIGMGASLGELGPGDSHAPGHVRNTAVSADSRATSEVRQDAAPLADVRIVPLAPGRFELRCTLGQQAHDQLHHARALLGHAIPDGDLAKVLERAIEQLVRTLEQKSITAPARKRSSRPSSDPRHIPAHIRREVWQRDGGRCTFTSEVGQRCPAESRLEFDHVRPVARGGASTTDNLRLRCRAHNQFDAEQMFGAGFMQAKRKEAATSRAPGVANKLAPEQEEVMPFLRKLGFRPAEARYGAEACAHLTQQSLEVRVRHAISTLAPPRARRAEPAGAA